ncbi:MAG: hypothetical protein EHM42_08760 [Planctomycetaceae bacterium]|nr:MAG: hypothetical protein EHM42_08760 [Planctomycetaceae bacterium]
MSSARQSWLDDKSQTTLIDDYAKKLTSFVDVMEDGKVEQQELTAQEARLVELMKEVEPKLSDELHGKVTRLLCELTAYNIMEVLHELHASRPWSKATWRP